MNSERGSAIIMLFIAVALFGALAYAFLKGSRSSTGLMTDEQAKTYAQMLISFSNELKSGTKRLQLRGCKENAISFANSVYKTTSDVLLNADGHNPNSPTNGSCDLFKVSGAGLTPLILPDGALKLVVTNTWNSNAFRINAAPVLNVGSDTKREIVLYGGSLTQQVCMALNTALGIKNPPNDAPSDDQNSGPMVYPDNLLDAVSGFIGDYDSALAGKPSGCFKRTSDGAYMFYSTVLPR